MDKLEHIFELQKAFDDRLAKERGLDYTCTSLWVQKGILAILSELAELLDEVNFKWWKSPHELNQQAIEEELVDILHFYVGLCLKAGVTAEQLYQAYLEKNLENHRRQDGLSKGGYAVENKRESGCA